MLGFLLCLAIAGEPVAEIVSAAVAREADFIKFRRVIVCCFCFMNTSLIINVNI